MSTPGRNDPCPCGSGKKYKKCHGEQQAGAEGLEQWKRTISMDQRLMTAVAKLGASRFTDKGFDPFFLEPEEEHDHDHEHGEDCHHEVMFADVSFPLALFSDLRFEKPLAALFLEAKGAFLAPDERAWLQAQLKTSFSLWQLVGMGDGGEITIKERLGDREITLFDGDAHKEGKKGDLMLGRVVEHEGRAIMTSIHPEIIEAEDVEEAVTQIQEHLKTATGDTYAHQLALVDAWHDVVYGEDEEDAA